MAIEHGLQATRCFWMASRMLTMLFPDCLTEEEDSSEKSILFFFCFNSQELGSDYALWSSEDWRSVIMSESDLTLRIQKKEKKIKKQQ